MSRYKSLLILLGLHAALFALHSGGYLTGKAFRKPITSPAPATPRFDSPLRDRLTFARSLRLVEEGMPQDQVRKLLGEPDDIWRGDEVNACQTGFVYREGKESWCYGGEGHLTFPTLGKVTFDTRGKVVNVLGKFDQHPGTISINSRGEWIETPPLTAWLPNQHLPPEPETRRILRMIFRLRRYDSSNNPLRVIQVVNALQPLGKAGALAVIDEFQRVNDPYLDGTDGLFVVIRCLFEVPDPPGSFPPMLVGMPHPEPPKDLRQSPRFPVVLFRDIPFCPINGYSLAGMAEPLSSHLEPYRKSGVLRSQPLRPPDNPLEVIEDLVASSAWPNWGDEQEWGRSVAREQALRLVDSVYRLEETEFDSRLDGYYSDQEPQWRTHCRRFAQLNARWDPAQNTYVFPDGTFLPPRPEPLTYPRTWVASVSNGTVEVTLRRQHRTSVYYSLTSKGVQPPMPLLQMFVSGTEIEEDAGLSIPRAGSRVSGFKAPEGANIHLILKRKGKTVAQTVLQP